MIAAPDQHIVRAGERGLLGAKNSEGQPVADEAGRGYRRCTEGGELGRVARREVGDPPGNVPEHRRIEADGNERVHQRAAVQNDPPRRVRLRVGDRDRDRIGIQPANEVDERLLEPREAGVAEPLGPAGLEEVAKTGPRVGPEFRRSGALRGDS